MLGEYNFHAKKERGRLKIKIWLRGSDITADKIFCFSPPLKSLLVLHHSGNLIDKISFKENMDNNNLYSHHFISKNGDEYNFTDNENAQVRIYQIVRE